MYLRTEATVNESLEFSGIGVHSGKTSNIKIIPAEVKTGIIFKRTDVAENKSLIKLSTASIVNPVLCTRIVNKDGISMSVVEHLLAAFRIVGITNAIVEVDSEEIPIMDGSAKIFVEGIRRSGICLQDSFAPAIIINKPVRIANQNGEISIEPANTSKITLTLSYDRINPVIKNNNSHTCELDDNLLDIASARTFGWLDDYEKIQTIGGAKGASEENTIIIMPDHTIKNSLRYEKELVMHKCLDLIGDLSILGYDIIGEIRGINTSHALNNMLIKQIIAEIKTHTIITEVSEQKYSNIKYAIH
ncbi:MAG: UDP-3-O-acyl-N-acetylglucosamine deacetylase [Holosporales bacterium]|jgi:UDP-3-O-[3-hydroxymyristoyl] N-acetylglucosamine deacetylase|nr:UDP-3-O-acyl-N-acetylglucosamine deacetylase [Holosporales bacterium]